MRILAIDPGLYATAVVYGPQFSADSGMRWNFLDVPVIGEGNTRRPDGKELRRFIQQFAPNVGIIELVGPMPQQGLASTAAFMRSVGILWGVTEACSVELHAIAPQRWKKHFNLMKTAKEGSRQKALELIPEIAAQLTRKKDHGRAEAALMALYLESKVRPVE